MSLAFDSAGCTDRDIYMVFDDFGALGRSWRETDEAETDREREVAMRFKPWTEEEVALLNKLRAAGASPGRVASSRRWRTK